MIFDIKKDKERVIYINEYGNQDNPKLILLAPMMVSGEDLHRLMSPYLTGEYFIIAPDQGGHGRAGNYTSAEDEYTQLKYYLLDKGYTKIELFFGERDFDLPYSKKAISTYMPKAETVIRKGYPHCSYMAAHRKEYVEELERFIGGG